MAFWAVVLIVVAAFVIAEPRFAPAPVIVPERESLDDPQEILGPVERMRLGLAIESPEYAEELAARRALLDPEGVWATWWAKHFHGWVPRPEAAGLDELHGLPDGDPAHTELGRELELGGKPEAGLPFATFDLFGQQLL